MDILAWSDSAKRDVESRGWIKEDSNRQSADTIREEGGVVVRKVEVADTLRLPECDALCLWLARLPIQNNHPRTLLFPKAWDDSVRLVQSDELLVSVFERLTEDGFLGCPVVDVDNMYLSQVDVLDILCYICSLFKAQYDDDDLYLVPKSPLRKQAWSDFFELDGFKTARVNHLLTRAAARWESPRIACQPSYVGCSSLGVLEQMARLGSHRVPVLSDAGQVLGLVTQSMFISLFSQQLHRLGRLKELWVGELINSLTPAPFVVSMDSLTINAFKLMAKHSVAGLGVVDAGGYLVGAISVKDLHGIGCRAEHFERLWYPVSQFLKKTQSTPQLPATVSSMDTLQTVLQQMDDGNVHLVFVVSGESDQKQRPLRVITQRDVLKIVCSHMGIGPL